MAVLFSLNESSGQLMTGWEEDPHSILLLLKLGGNIGELVRYSLNS